MKKLKLNGKLKLNKETVSVLTNKQASEIRGGNEAILISIGCVCSKRNHCDRTLTVACG